MNLGTSIVIKGDLIASEDLTLYGQMEGTVTLNGGHTLTIGRYADIRATIDAKAVVIQGAVTGNVTAREKVEIQTTGSCLATSALPASPSPTAPPSAARCTFLRVAISSQPSAVSCQPNLTSTIDRPGLKALS